MASFFTVNGKNINPCPECQNNTHFVARSRQCSEDSCEVWVECTCGYDPTKNDCYDRVECVWGSLDRDNILMSLGVWNELTPGECCF